MNKQVWFEVFFWTSIILSIGFVSVDPSGFYKEIWIYFTLAIAIICKAIPKYINELDEVDIMAFKKKKEAKATVQAVNIQPGEKVTESKPEIDGLTQENITYFQEVFGTSDPSTMAMYSELRSIKLLLNQLVEQNAELIAAVKEE